ncbi:hypothetical protein [Fusibacter sp. JL216-2]|uniref:hypothetical protein n=1 Tax=Fusibacter sp. JL216-2 TaxID=3071453 RepID=UPI003D3277F9
MKKIVDKALKVLSLVLLIGGTVLGFLATKKMGVQRSLYYRNTQLEAFFFDTKGLIGLIVLGGFYFWIIWKDKDRLNPVELAVFRVAAGFLVLTILLYVMTSFMGAPWIMLGAYAYFISVCVETIGNRR